MTESQAASPSVSPIAEAPALKPCPWCGGEASAEGTVRYSRSDATWADGTPIREAFYVNCLRCTISNQGAFGHRTREKAIESWNRRAPASLAQRSDDRPSVLSEEERALLAECATEYEDSAYACDTPLLRGFQIARRDKAKRLRELRARLTSGGSEPAGTLNSELKVGGEPAGDVLTEEEMRWPVADCLAKLASAAEHLLDEHDCDTHGWEEIRAASRAARKHAARLSGRESA